MWTSGLFAACTQCNGPLVAHDELYDLVDHVVVGKQTCTNESCKASHLYSRRPTKEETYRARSIDRARRQVPIEEVHERQLGLFAE